MIVQRSYSRGGRVGERLTSHDIAFLYLIETFASYPYSEEPSCGCEPEVKSKGKR